MTKTARRVVQAVFLIIATGLLTISLVRQWDDVSDQLANVDLVRLAAATLAAFAAALTTAESWRVLLADLGSGLGRLTGARIFFVGQLGKYLPGSIWPVVAQSEAAAAHGVTRRVTATASLVNLAIVFTTGLFVAVSCAPIGAVESIESGWLLFPLLAVLVLILHPRVLNGIIARTMKLLRRPPSEQQLSGRAIAIGACWALAAWGFYGVHTAALAAGVGVHGVRETALAFGGFALAWTVGFAVVIAPAGGGARELVLAGVLSAAMPFGTATLIAVLSRLILTAADLVLAGVAAVLDRRYRARGTSAVRWADPPDGRDHPSSGSSPASDDESSSSSPLIS